MKYTLTDEEFNEIYEISRPVPLIILAGENITETRYKRADAFWNRISEKYQCRVSTISPCGNDMYSFEAEPL